MSDADQAGGQCIYQIDAEGRLVYVNEFWDTFARANDSGHLVGAQVLNTLLWDQISDPATRQLYRLIVERALRKGIALRFPFRCDGPATIRHMTMCVERVGAECCQFSSTIERVEVRPAVPLLDPRAARSERWLRICSWCKKVAVPPDRWAEVEAAMALLDVFADAPVPSLTHTMCPECHRERTADLAQNPPA